MISVVGSLPNFLIFILCAALLISALYARSEFMIARKKIMLTSIFSILGVASIFLAMYVVFTPVGGNLVSGIQGRYFLPFLIPILMIIAVLIPIEIKMKDKHVPYIMGTIGAFGLMANVVYYWLTLYH